MKPCGVADNGRECEEPKDKEMGDGFCTRHSYEWRRTKEFREAMRDDAVIFAASLRVPSLLKQAMRPHKKRWLDRMRKEAEQ